MSANERRIRLAATLTPRRAGPRRSIRLAGTMRDAGDAPCDIAIVDVSRTGFLAELPDGIALEPGTEVRVAATSLGRHLAVAVRHEGPRHGFVFRRPIGEALVADLESSAWNVVPLQTLAPATTGPSWQVSLAFASGAGVAAWSLLAVVLYLTA